LADYASDEGIVDGIREKKWPDHQIAVLMADEEDD